nr:cation transporter [Achromobacter xylosoxidans]
MTAFPPPLEDPEDDGHSPAERAVAAARSTWVSVGVNVVLATAQIVIGIFSKSQGLIADGIHSSSDLIADFIVLLANRHGQKAADADHYYGHCHYPELLSGQQRRYRRTRRRYHHVSPAHTSAQIPRIAAMKGQKMKVETSLQPGAVRLRPIGALISSSICSP